MGHGHGTEIKGSTYALGVFLSGIVTSGGGFGKSKITDLRAVEPITENAVGTAYLIGMIFRYVKVIGSKDAVCIILVGYLVIQISGRNRCTVIRSHAALLNDT